MNDIAEFFRNAASPDLEFLSHDFYDDDDGTRMLEIKYRSSALDRSFVCGASCRTDVDVKHAVMRAAHAATSYVAAKRAGLA